MAVNFFRMRSGKVQSFNRVAYGIENTALLPALYHMEKGKRRYLFGESAPELYPLLIKGTSQQEILSFLASAKGMRFTVRGTPIVEDEDDFDAMLTRELERKTGHSAYRAKNTMEGFEIYCKWHSHQLTNKAIEIHDGGMAAFKNIAMFGAGVGGGAIAGMLPSGGAGSTAGAALGFVKGLVGAAPDVYDIGKTVSGGGKGSGGGEIGLMVSMLPLNGGHNTKRSNLRAKRLAQIAATL